MPTSSDQPIPRFKNPLWNAWINEKTLFVVIILNAIAMFLDEFDDLSTASFGLFYWLDYSCTFFYIVELSLKIRLLSWKKFWSAGWNRFDFIVVVGSLPSILDPFMQTEVFELMLILRIGRLLRLLKLLRFIPHASHIFQGVVRALKAAFGILMAVVILLVIFSLGASILFHELAPTHFGNPLLSLYSLIKVFTLEGWYEIPEAVVQHSESITLGILVRVYFIVVVFFGGILGLSLVNAIFVDEMTLDNSWELEKRVDKLEQEIRRYQEIVTQNQTEHMKQISNELKQISERLDRL